jgi:hypothetical protein
MRCARGDRLSCARSGAITALPIAWLAERAQQSDRVRALQLRVLRILAERVAINSQLTSETDVHRRDRKPDWMDDACAVAGQHA